MSDTYFICIDNDAKNTVNITENEYNKIICDIESLTKYKKLMINYLTYHISVKSLEDLLKSNGIDMFNKMSLKNFAIPNAYVLNCLNTFYSFEEYCEKNFDWFKNDIEDSSGNTIRALKSEIYENNFSYKMLYNLRRHSTHHELPITQISGQFDIAKKEYKNYQLNINKKSLIDAKGMQASFIPDFNKNIKDDYFNVYPIIKEVDLLLSEIMVRLILNDRKIIVDIFDSYDKLFKTYNVKANIDLWKNSVIDMYLSSSIYVSYLNFDEGLSKTNYCLRYPVSKDVQELKKFLEYIKSIAIRNTPSEG